MHKTFRLEFVLDSNPGCHRPRGLETRAYVANILGLLNGAGDANLAGASSLETRLVC